MRKYIIAIAVAGLAGLAIWAVMAGCGKKPTEPVEAKEYKVYFIDEHSPYDYYYYSTATGSVDSFTLPYNSWESGIAISPDGKTMYLNPEGFIVEVSLDSHKVIAEHPVSFHDSPNTLWKEMAISPDGKFLAVVDKYLTIVDLSNYSIFYSEEQASCYNGRFSPDGGKFTCVILDSLGADVLSVDMSNGSAEVIRDFNNGIPFRAIYCKEMQRWFIYYKNGSDQYSFQVIDDKSDSVIFSVGLCPGTGDMEITPDNKLVYFSQPGKYLFICLPVEYFLSYDISQNQVDQVYFSDSTLPEILGSIKDLYITPDGRHLIGTALSRGQLFDYDIQNGKFLHSFEFSAGVTIRTLSGQTEP